MGNINWTNLFKVVDEANKALQTLRNAKEIGKSEEALAIIHLEGSDEELLGLFDSKLLKTLCKVSDLFYSDETLNRWPRFPIDKNWKKPENKEFSCTVVVESLRDNPAYTQCPRCFLYNMEDNYSGLCTRCARIIVNRFPERPEVYEILRHKRKGDGQSLEGLENFIEQLKQLKALGRNNDVFEDSYYEDDI